MGETPRRRARTILRTCDSRCKDCRTDYSSDRVKGPRCGPCKKVYKDDLKARKTPKVPTWLSALVVKPVDLAGIETEVRAPSPLRSRRIKMD